MRQCRSCKQNLPPSRYFNCKECIPELDSDDGDFIYAGFDSVVEEVEEMCNET